MTKAEFIERVFKDNRPRRVARVAIAEMVETAFDLMTQGIAKDGKFTYPGFGALLLRKRKERKGRNPKTGSSLIIPANRTVAFRAAPKLKESLR
jgi:nucleoid DNA-binding protein